MSKFKTVKELYSALALGCKVTNKYFDKGVYLILRDDGKLECNVGKGAYKLPDYNSIDAFIEDGWQVSDTVVENQFTKEDLESIFKSLALVGAFVGVTGISKDVQRYEELINKVRSLIKVME